MITTNIQLALAALKQGHVVAIPTETVYGLAADATNEDAIKKVFQLKNRPLDHPLIMHVATHWDLSQWIATIPDYAQRLMEHFWPGPLTLVMKSRPGQVSSLITAGQDTVAIRCPSHPVAQALLTQLDTPLVAPSANPFGKISPTTAEHVQYSFAQDNLLILDGGRCQVGIESTIVAATDPQKCQILRQGLISERDIAQILPHEFLAYECTDMKVPGNLASHYQPEKPLYCFTTIEAISRFCQQADQVVYVISFNDVIQREPHSYYQLPFSPEKAAFELYYQLRAADQSKASLIAIELPPDEASWQGIRERLLKASSPS